MLFVAIWALDRGSSEKLGKTGIAVEVRQRIAGNEEKEAAADESRAIDALLARTPILRRGSGSEREVALTFDDGPSPYTAQIVGILVRHRAPATFFPVGDMIERFPAGVRAALASGFAIGDHTQSHARMAALRPRQQRAELLGQAAALRRQGVPFPRLFRPPFGVYDDATLKLLRRRHMLMVLWTVETADYERPGDAAIVRRVLGGVRPGAIVLLHDGGGDRSQTVAALPQIIRGLRARDYKLVTVPQLVLDGSAG